MKENKMSKNKSKMSYTQREQARKRTAAIKASLIAKATEALERLWSVCHQPESGFQPGDRRAIANACHSIRAVRGGWAARR
jgi:hypothetical protein